ncbi:hypothetical protein [Streptomyces exfoliatus]|uniref:hypothetical protein n=1 Tax=Streptomyces exfoliatus TaxID=1905 RepID=UPI003C2CF94D
MPILIGDDPWWPGPGGVRPPPAWGRALSARGALALHSLDGALSFALRAALATAPTAVPMALARRAD